MHFSHNGVAARVRRVLARSGVPAADELHVAPFMYSAVILLLLLRLLLLAHIPHDVFGFVCFRIAFVMDRWQ